MPTPPRTYQKASGMFYIRLLIDDLAKLTKGDVIAIDGKCLRRSLDKASKKAAIHMVSAWTHRNNLGHSAANLAVVRSPSYRPKSDQA